MLRIPLITLGIAGLLSASIAQADGLFRRLPQPGEYAVYKTLLFVTSEEGEAFDRIPEIEGKLTLKCVGVEDIDGERHSWIEINTDYGDSSTLSSAAFTVKVLVADAEFLTGDPVENFVRGWYAAPESMEPTALTQEHVHSTTDQMPLWLRASFRGIEGDSETLDQSQTVEFGGCSLTIATAEHGNFAGDVLEDDSNGRMPISGWGTWWLHEDAAFGVAAMEQLWSLEFEPVGTLDFAVQCTLTEFGADAVTQFPDHN